MKARTIVFILFLSLLFSCAGSRKDTRMPKVKGKLQLDYPLSAQLNRIEGQVLVGVFVNQDGRAQLVELLESSGSEELDTAAQDYAKNIEYEPALLNGKTIEAWTKLLLRYRLTEVPFNPTQWVMDVSYYHSKVENSKDSLQREKNLRRVYANLHGLSHHAAKNPEVKVNDYILNVITDDIRQKYKPFWNTFVAPFAVYDDFLHRYPSCSFIDRVKEDLEDQLIDTQYAIKIRSVKKSRLLSKSENLLQIIDQRLQELNQLKDKDKADVAEVRGR